MNKLVFLLFFLLTFQVSHAYSDTIQIYSDVSDGHVTTAPYPASWDTQYYSGQGRNVEDKLDYLRIKSGSLDSVNGYTGIVRSFLTFDTTNVSESKKLIDAYLVVHPTSVRDDFNDSVSYVNVFQSYQENNITLQNEDISNCGLTLEDPVKLSADQDLTDIEVGVPLRFRLDVENMDWFSPGSYTKLCLREGHDIENVEASIETYTGTWKESWLYIASGETIASSTAPSLELVFEEKTDVERENLYTQIESPYPSETETADWADDKFARAMSANAIQGCETIAKCGCAITSLVMMARESGIEESVEGGDVNPGTFNQWLIENGGYDSRGNVFWERAVDFFGERKQGGIETPFSLNDHRVTADEEVASAVGDSAKKVLGFHSPAGHYVYLNNLIDNGYGVLDPLWFNTETSNDEDDRANKVRDYNDEMQRGVVYEYGSLKSKRGNVQINLNSPAELLLINEEGQKTGYEAGDTLEEIEVSGYVQDEFLQDQLSDEENNHRTKTLVARDMEGIAELRVIGTGNGTYDLDISMYDTEGNYTLTSYSTTTEVDDIDYYLINFDEGTVTPKDAEKPKDSLDRAAFIALVESAVEDERRYVKKFFVRYAHKIYDAIDRDRSRLAKIKLRVFKKFLRVKRINDEDLFDAIKELRQELKNN